jgi:23S rRNA pseudouridine1911/1915/1917 synthase
MTFLPTDFVVGAARYLADDSMRVDVIFENEDLLVVNKPAGVKTHPNSPGEVGTMMNFVQAYLTNQEGKDAYMVHRLDGETTGALIVAKAPYVVPMLNEGLKNKSIGRTYVTWVHGSIEGKSGIINLPIGLDSLDDRKRKVDFEHGLTAETRWTKVHQVYQYTLLRVQLGTGRTHQIRVHFSAIGHPVVGDGLYGGGDGSHRRLMLHAAAVYLLIPFSKVKISISASLPDAFPLNMR